MNPSKKIHFFNNLAPAEEEAIMQVRNTASMPFVRGVAVMPDVHFGRGSTVGTVLATKGAIIPAAVGVDIGCGMIAVRTNLKPEQVMPHRKEIREAIERVIPVGIGPRGMNSWTFPSAEARLARLETLAVETGFIPEARFGDWRKQLGSLGGGNHFIEVCVGHPVNTEMQVFEGESVWVILHSGSRGIGNKTGTHWTNYAKKQAQLRGYFDLLPDPDLAYLIDPSDVHWYMQELNWCQEYARLNREEMMDRVLHQISCSVYGINLEPTDEEGCAAAWCGTGHFTIAPNPPIEVERINCHHNYAQMEPHNGENVLITRKGAIDASVGVRGLIPGSMGARSYIVTGLGNAGAYNSAPHGAGRSMSRRAARDKFNVEGVRAEMEAKGIEARVREAIVDEAPGAYKDIDLVMADAACLVRTTDVLSQIISVKGD